MDTAPGSPQTPDAEMIEALLNLELIEDVTQTQFEALTGGVSSDIWKVTTNDQVFCVKRALAKLKVESDWFAPVERNRFEVDWYQTANEIAPGTAPHILAHDQEAMLFAMEYLDSRTHPTWKYELRDGRADPQVAEECGQRLVRIHAATANNPKISERFHRTDIFQAIRLEPYLQATAIRHPDLQDTLFALSQRTADTKLALIHGDVSPKNILVGESGPVFLDAECACMGDPAFDLAFCLNHLLLKCMWTPPVQKEFLACFNHMATAYLAGVDWESRDTLEARIASLLPGLLLARVDGKSPVEYITKQSDKDKIRRCARQLLFDPPDRLAELTAAWEMELDL